MQESKVAILYSSRFLPYPCSPGADSRRMEERSQSFIHQGSYPTELDAVVKRGVSEIWSQSFIHQGSYPTR